MNFWFGVILTYLAGFLYSKLADQMNWHPSARLARKPAFNFPLLLPLLWAVLVAAFVAAGVLMETMTFGQGVLVIGVALGIHSLLLGFFASHNTARYVADLALQQERQAAEELAQTGDISARWAMYPPWIPGMHFLLAVFVQLLIFSSESESYHFLADFPAFLSVLYYGKEFVRRVTVKGGTTVAEVRKEKLAK